MTATEFSKIWNELNEAQCELISARQAMTKQLCLARLKSAQRVVKKVDKMMQNLMTGDDLKK